MAVLSCKDVKKTYVVDKILDGIDFNLELGDKVGVIGLNGSGKTTLFDILSGRISKDSGEIFIPKDMKVGYLRQHVNIDSDRTIFEECLEVFKPLIGMEEDLRKLEEEIAKNSGQESEKLDRLMERYGNLSEKFIGLNGYGYKSDIRGVLSGLGFLEEDFDKDINLLSGGQKSRISLAKLLLENPDILLLDEPTNHLDIEAINWLEKFLTDYKGTALIISHDRFFLDNVVNRIFLLENKTITIYNSDYTRFMDQRKKDLEVLKRQYDNQQKELKRQEEIIERFMNYGDARYIKQAQSRQKMVDQMKKLEKPSKDSKTRIRFEPKVKSGRDVLKVEELNKSFGDLHLLNDLAFELYRGERVGLIGGNGTGKTTLFKIILGEEDEDSGTVEIGHKVNFGYFDQEMKSLDLGKTVMDEVWDDNPKLKYYDIRKLLSQFLFLGDDILKEVKDLSGGEKGRLNLLKLMLSEANLLLMDEPTNHLDIDSKEVLEDALLDYDGTLFVVSHDRYFLNSVCTKILELTEDGITEYLGNYDYFLEKKNEAQQEEEEDGNKRTKTQIKNDKKKEREKRLQEKQARETILSLEEEIEKKEGKLESIDEELCRKDIYEDSEKLVKLTKTREETSEKIEDLYEKWIELSGS